MQRVIYYVIVIVSVLGIVSCKPGIPRKYLKSDKMADIMYDLSYCGGYTERAGYWRHGYHACLLGIYIEEA